MRHARIGNWAGSLPGAHATASARLPLRLKSGGDLSRGGRRHAHRRLLKSIQRPRAATNAARSTTAEQFVFGGQLARLLHEGEDWLTHRILGYAKRQRFTRYTSTLAEAWRLSINGLTASLLAAIGHYRSVPELGPDEADPSDPVAHFAVQEARRHRARGVTLGMFLGLYKYYRQSYQDLIELAPISVAERRLSARFIERVFDRIEVTLYSEWATRSESELLGELRRSNRTMTNEKNAYLTVFESILTPALLLDTEGRIVTLNHAATKLVRVNAVPGAAYYADDGPRARADSWNPRGQSVEALFPWLPGKGALLAEDAPSPLVESTFPDELNPRIFEVRASKLVDVSEKMIGTVVVLNDVTEHKALVERLYRLARTDSLTGVNNRRHFLELARRESLRAWRYSRDMSVLVIDVDHFKEVNDTYGHAVGDQLLTALAHTMSHTLRAVDALGRIGGEEFAIVLPETTRDRAVFAAERIRSRVGRMVVRTDAGPVGVTVSIGVATLAPSDLSLDDLLVRADDALYRAKTLGRNRVVAAFPTRPHQPSGPTSSFIRERPVGADGAGAGLRRDRAHRA